MKLDFTTLYVIVFLNSVGFTIVWAIVSTSYRSLIAARYWFAALIFTCISGPFLVLGEHAQWTNYVGNALVVLGFGLMWQGLRVFNQQPPLWGWLATLLSLSIIAMIFFGGSQPANNVIFAVSQIVQMSLALITLLAAPNRQIGVWVAAGSCGLLIIGQSLEAITNLLRITGLLSSDTYYIYASWFLVLAILGASISNLGFLLMTIDKLRNELFILALRDELTDLPNRRALINKINSLEKLCRHSNSHITTFMIDLDKFKMINDIYGHSAGDAALIHFSDIIKRNLNDDAFFARMGGDEFCILMPDIDAGYAYELAERMSKDIASTPIIWKERAVTLSASIGIHHWDPQSGDPLLLSLSHADDHLIQTKYGTSKFADSVPAYS